MRSIVTVVAGGLLLGTAAHTLSWRHAMAEGALAFGSTGDILKDGFAFGYANNWRTSEKAAAEALRQCQTFKDAKKAAAKCKVVATYRRECVAVAFDPKISKGGVGWAVGPSEEAVKARAVAACQGTADAGRAQFCKVDKFYCDTKDEND